MSLADGLRPARPGARTAPSGVGRCAAEFLASVTHGPRSLVSVGFREFRKLPTDKGHEAVGHGRPKRCSNATYPLGETRGDHGTSLLPVSASRADRGCTCPAVCRIPNFSPASKMRSAWSKSGYRAASVMSPPHSPCNFLAGKQRNQPVPPGPRRREFSAPPPPPGRETGKKSRRPTSIWFLMEWGGNPRFLAAIPAAASAWMRAERCNGQEQPHPEGDCSRLSCRIWRPPLWATDTGREILDRGFGRDGQGKSFQPDSLRRR